MAHLRRYYAGVSGVVCYQSRWVQYGRPLDEALARHTADAAEQPPIASPDDPTRLLYPWRRTDIWAATDERVRTEVVESQYSRGPVALTTQAAIFTPTSSFWSRTLLAPEVTGTVSKAGVRQDPWTGVDITQPGMNECPLLLVRRFIRWFEDHPFDAWTRDEGRILALHTAERDALLEIDLSDGLIVRRRETLSSGSVIEIVYSGRFRAGVYPAPHPAQFTSHSPSLASSPGYSPGLMVCQTLVSHPHVDERLFDWRTMAPMLRDASTGAVLERTGGALAHPEVASQPVRIDLPAPPAAPNQLRPTPVVGTFVGPTLVCLGAAILLVAGVLWRRAT